jgi:hypothetical protein
MNASIFAVLDEMRNIEAIKGKASSRLDQAKLYLRRKTPVKKSLGNDSTSVMAWKPGIDLIGGE